MNCDRGKIEATEFVLVNQHKSKPTWSLLIGSMHNPLPCNIFGIDTVICWFTAHGS